MLESSIEARLRDKVRDELDGKAFKFVSPGSNGVPDRLILLPGGRTIFCELKAPGKRPTPQQLRVHGYLRSLGFPVFVIDSMAGVDDLIQTCGLSWTTVLKAGGARMEW